MIRRTAAMLASLVVLPLAALAGEEEDTQTPAPSPTPSISFGAAAIDVNGDEAFGRQLLDEPEDVRSGFRWLFPMTGPAWSGGHSADVSSSREGSFRAWAQAKDGRRVTLTVRADRRPLAFRTRSPVSQDPLGSDEPGTHRESARLAYRAPLPLPKGRLELFAEWRGGGGVRPSTGAAYATGDAGPVFLAPAWRSGDESSASAGAAVRAEVLGAMLRADARVASESARSTYHAPDTLPAPGGLSVASNNRRQVIEAGVSADVPTGSLVAGGGYRVRAERTEPRGGRRIDAPNAPAGSTTLDDADVRSLSHRGALGLGWLPIPSLRAGVTATALSEAIRANSLERRDLAESEITRGDASLDRFETAVSADVAWAPLSRVSVEARAGAESGRFEDRWTWIQLASDGTTPLTSRAQSATRDRTATKAEASVTGGPWRGVRATAGGSLESESWDVSADRDVEAPVLDDRTRSRTTVFARLRTRPLQGVSLDGRAKVFHEERDLGGTAPERRGSDVRARATFTGTGGASVFVLGAQTDDRYELAPLPTSGSAVGFAPIEFAGRSYIGTLGFAVPVMKTWHGSLHMTRVLHTGDLDSRLTDTSVDVSGPVNDRLRLAVGVRQISFLDDHAPWGDADAVAGFAVLSGAF